MGFGSAIGDIYGGRRIGMKPYKPSRATIRDLYETKAGGDINRLYNEGDPFTGRGLGYSPEVMEGLFGRGSDAFTAGRMGEEQGIADVYRNLGTTGTLVGSYYRAKQRARSSELGRRAGQRREALFEGAQQGRRDLYNRLGAAQSLGGDLAGHRRSAEAMKYAEMVRSREKTGAGIGDLVASIASLGVGGGMGGAAGAGAGATSAGAWRQPSLDQYRNMGF